MKNKVMRSPSVRWTLSVMLIVLGLTATWAWGEAAQLAASPRAAEPAGPEVLYTAWQPDVAAHASLFRTEDKGVTWQPVDSTEIGEIEPVAWASDGRDRVAVALADGRLLRSENRGQEWTAAGDGLAVLSLVWGQDGVLYAGTDRQGLYRLAANSAPAQITPDSSELATAAVEHLALSEGRLFAATPNVLFYTDDDGTVWTKSLPVPARISALAVTNRSTAYVGTETVGVYRTQDAGQSWETAAEGLGLAAGQAVQVTALKADPQEPGVLYAAVGYVLGGTHTVLSAEGTFVTLDGGQFWQRLAGPGFPQAQRATDLLLLTGKPLSALAVTASGVQGYAPDVTGALTALSEAQPAVRARAARLLGLARAQAAGEALLSALADSDPAVSLAASEALGRIGDPENAGKLLVALDHPQEQVRLGAARALGLMGNTAAVEPLREMLLTDDGAAMSVAAEALGRIDAPAASDALLAALADERLSARRHAALGALEDSGEAAVAPLLKMMDDSRDAQARENAAEALGWIGSAQATPALTTALGDENEAVRQRAAWALGEIGDPAARAALERAAARDDSAAVQSAAQAALARLAEQPARTSAQPLSLATALNRLQPVRWLLLAGTWAAAAWLILSGARPTAVPAMLRRRS